MRRSDAGAEEAQFDGVIQQLRAQLPFLPGTGDGSS